VFYNSVGLLGDRGKDRPDSQIYLHYSDLEVLCNRLSLVTGKTVLRFALTFRSDLLLNTSEDHRRPIVVLYYDISP
jgi:hypothetical protein